MVRHLAEALPVKIAFVTECANVENWQRQSSIVSFVDHAGLELLHTWQARGNTMLNCPLFLKEM